MTRLERAQALLNATLNGTAAVTGPAFFDTAVETLANALGVHTTFVAAPSTERPGWNRLIAHWSGQGWGELIDYERAGTPCELSLDRELVSITSDVQKQFPDDEWLRSLGASSYVALQLTSSDGRRLGHLGVLDTKPSALSEDEISSLRIFGSRIAAELERVRLHAKHDDDAAFQSRLLALAPFATTYRNTETGLEHANPAFEQIFGRTYPEARQIGWAEIIHPDDLEQYLEQSERLRTSGEAASATFRIQHPDRSVRWVQRHGAAKLNDCGKPIEIYTVTADLTDAHAANLEAERAVIELRLRDAETTSSLNAFADIRFRVDEHGTFLDVWAGESSVLSVPPDEIIGTNISDHFSPEPAAEIIQAIKATVDTGEVSSVKYRLGGADTGVHYEARIAPLANRQVIAVARDISDLKALETQLIHASTMQSVGRLAGGIAHDFNNVLHVIRGHASALRRPDLNDEDIERRVDAITRAVDRTASLIERLMTLSRPTADNPSPTVLDDFISRLAPTLSHMLGETIALEVRLGAPDCATIIDDGRLEAALLNLISNASDAMPNGGALRIVTTTHNSAVRLEVSDTGSGMDDNVAGHVFEPFFTTKSAGVGTGLGLASTYDSIVAAGGTINVTSQSGEGTTFVIELPTTDLRPETTPSNEAPTNSGTRATTILVVEDEPDVLELCADALTEFGYSVLRASNGDEALALADQHAPIDGLLTDVVMPGLSGPALADKLTNRYPGTPVVFMSGYSPDTLTPAIPPDRVLRKPFAQSELREMMVVHLP